jgi:hypothetical protein
MSAFTLNLSSPTGAFANGIFWKLRYFVPIKEVLHAPITGPSLVITVGFSIFVEKKILLPKPVFPLVIFALD